MEWKRITSRFDGTCKVCKKPYKKTDLIAWTKESGAVCNSCSSSKTPEEIMASYICGHCGERGHNRRTCKKLALERTGYAVGSVVDSSDPLHEPLRPKAPEVPAAPAKVKKSPEWKLLEKVIDRARLILLYGPPGTGKTHAGNFLGSPTSVSNVTITDDMPAAELRGHFIPKGGEFVWMDGPALAEFRRGGRLIANELDKACGDVLTFFHSLLDDPGVAYLTLPTGEVVRPGEGFQCIATINGTPMDLPEALRDRFAVKINIAQLHPNAVATLPEDLRIPAMNGISTDGSRSVSMRGWKTFAELREAIGESDAASAVFGSNAKTILNTIKIGAAEYGVYSTTPDPVDEDDIPFS
jgi:predicted RNA-binding Zn-ribbon protein involved in translation (DUF1610 family)